MKNIHERSEAGRGGIPLRKIEVPCSDDAELLQQIRSIIKKIQKNCSSSQAAEYLDIDEDFIQIIYQIAEQMAPDYDVEKIFEIYQAQNKRCN